MPSRYNMTWIVPTECQLLRLWIGKIANWILDLTIEIHSLANGTYIILWIKKWDQQISYGCLCECLDFFIILKSVQYMHYRITEIICVIQFLHPDSLVYGRDSHNKDETVMRTSYPYNGYGPTGKITSLYWINPLAKCITIISESRYHNLNMMVSCQKGPTCHAYAMAYRARFGRIPLNRNKAQKNSMHILWDILHLLICL